MTETLYSSARNLLVNSSEVTNLVPAKNITVGFTQEPISYPCISITKVAGSDLGYLGYSTSAAGSKMRKSSNSVQIDIYNRDSLLSSQIIGRAVTQTLLDGLSCKKVSEVDIYEENLKAYRKIQTWDVLFIEND